MKLHTLILLAALLHSGSCADSDWCETLIAHVGEKATIRCRVTNPDQDGVYMYRQRDENSKHETVSYYYKDGTFTPETPYTSRLETNMNLSAFSVSISSVSEHDSGVYWCRFNKRDVNTNSERTCLKVQAEIKQTFAEATKSDSDKQSIYMCVIGGLSFIILVLVFVLVLVCRERGNYTPRQHHASNGVYEVMRGNTPKALVNPAYESRQRATRPDEY